MALEPRPDGPPSDGAPAPDPSMDDILASIRRILDEEGTRGAAPPTDPFHDAAVPEPRLPEADLPDAHPPDIFELKPSMMLPDPDVGQAGPIPVPSTMFAAPVAVPAAPAPERPPLPPMVLPTSEPPPAEPLPTLVAPAAAAAAAFSVGALVRTLANERGTAVSRSGPTIEDLVREEMRPLLKEWLDTHLPPLVERLVRAEIERVVSRSA